MEATSHAPVARASGPAWWGMNGGNFELLALTEISEDCFSLTLLLDQQRCFEHMDHSKVFIFDFI